MLNGCKILYTNCWFTAVVFLLFLYLTQLLSGNKSIFIKFVNTLKVLSKDSVTVSVDAVIYYRVHNPVMAVNNVENVDESTKLLAQTTLRNILGVKNLSEILSDREHISTNMRVNIII